MGKPGLLTTCTIVWMLVLVALLCQFVAMLLCFQISVITLVNTMLSYVVDIDTKSLKKYSSNKT